MSTTIAASAATTPLGQIEEALILLRRARRLLRKAHAKRAAGAARRAVSSAEGAARHALRMEDQRRWAANDDAAQPLAA